MSRTISPEDAMIPAPRRVPAGALHPTRPWRALFRKTLAETMYVMIGTWAVAGLWIVAVWYSASDGLRRPLHLSGLVMDPFMTGAVAVGCAVVGFLVGLLQFWPLRQFDQWALLVHRPVSRAGLLGWSSVAGLAVYGITMGVPLGIFLAWGMVDRAVTPVFYWRFFGPYIASVATGGVMYFVGAVTILRQARWYGTRLLPLAGGVLIVGLSLVLRELTMVLAVDGLALAAFALAAWGGVVSQGRMERVPVAARAGLLASLTLGCVLGAYLVGMLGDALVTAYVVERYPFHSADGATYAGAEQSFLADGHIAVMILIRTYRRIGNNDFTEISTEIVNRADQPLPDAMPLGGTYSTGGAFRRATGGSDQYPYYNYRSMDAVTSPVTVSRPVPPVKPAGLTLAPEEVLDGVQPLDRNQNGNHPPPHWDVAVTNKHIYLVDRDVQKVLAALPLNYSLRDYYLYLDVDYGRHFVIAYYNNPHYEDSFSSWRHRMAGHPDFRRQYEVYDMQGNLIDAADSLQLDPVLSRYKDPLANEREAEWQRISFARGMIHGLGMSLAAVPLERWTTVPGRYEQMEGYWYFQAFTGTIVVNVLGAAILLGVARWYRLRAAVAGAWVFSGLILGPLMLVALVSFYWFPVCVSCPTCRRKRSIERWRCRHCGSGFPMPGANGTEIFAGALPAAAPAMLAAVQRDGGKAE